MAWLFMHHEEHDFGRLLQEPSSPYFSDFPSLSLWHLISNFQNAKLCFWTIFFFFLRNCLFFPEELSQNHLIMKSVSPI